MVDNELLSIKKFSKLTGIKGSTLRYYDDLGLFSPAARGENNYRYYQPQQIITINSIELLHELDMTVRQICDIEKNRSPESVHKALGEKEQELEEELARLNESYRVIHTIRSLICQGLSVDENYVYHRHLEAMPMIIGPDNDFKGSDNFYETFLEFCSEAKNRGVDLRFPVGGLYNDMNSFMADSSQPNQFFSFDPNGTDIREAGNYLVGYTRGYYGVIHDVQDRILGYAKAHNLKITGPVTALYIHDEICMRDQSQYLCEIQVRVEL
jgi:DNA-binding transcriptional MerR regulator